MSQIVGVASVGVAIRNQMSKQLSSKYEGLRWWKIGVRCFKFVGYVEFPRHASMGKTRDSCTVKISVYPRIVCGEFSIF